MEVALLALMIPVTALCIPIVAIVCSHRARITEMKLRARQGADHAVIAQLEDLKRQVTELRDTATSYDMSFDTALQRLDARLTALEQQRAHTLEQRA